VSQNIEAITDAQRADLLQLRLDEANLLIEDLLRKLSTLRAENEALWEERGRPQGR